ncbi:hypothetical protein VitviT2T_018384 [Vitis vinifera]|uniref:PI4-kinase N-terminal domain-containing protein n=1 Tax=Vitis vinifera TaxID=29760 RepID=A0ABY9CZS2_VITVI|nr:hypothetical protein VitviT2T_018384 [Vitis vinifera]
MLLCSSHQLQKTSWLLMPMRRNLIPPLINQANLLVIRQLKSRSEEHIRDIPVNLLGQPRERFLQVLWNSSCLHSLLFSVDDESPSTLSNDATNSELSKLASDQHEYESDGSLYLDCPFVDDLQANKRWQVQILKNSFNTVELVRKWEGLQQLQTLAHNEHLQFFRTELTPQKLHNS